MRWTRATSVLVSALLLAACTGDDDGGGGDSSEATTTSQGSDPLMIETTSGPVQGAESDVESVRHYLGIPFAEPPVGDLAWRPPQPREATPAVFDATTPADACPQTGEGTTTTFVITPPSDPDCLTLSIWSPDDAEDLPVMVWIHGGGLSTGSAHETYYTGDDLAAEGVVVVNVNYRLGPQGFLALGELAEEADDDAAGNYGLLDQQAGLEWVQDNIAGFGGDPEAVTIFGESAGGRSVCAHLAAPGSEGLFDRAIVQSGGGCGPFLPLEEANEDGERFLDEVGCDDVACLRERSDVELIAAADTLADADDEAEEVDFTFVDDGVNLSESARERAEQGELDDVPVLIGSNANEATLFTASLDEPSDAELVDLVADVTDDPDALLELYPPGAFESNLERYRTLLTDLRYNCPTLEFAATAPGAYVYHYTSPFGLQAVHGAELAPLFNHPEGIDIAIEPTREGARLSDLMQGAWTSFATTGDPGDEFDPYAGGETVTLIDVPLEQVDEIRGGRCPAAGELSTLTR